MSGSVRHPDLTAPRVAWPTLLLLLAGLATWCAALALTSRGALGAGPLLATAAAFALFTPMHDAAHRGRATER